jgi:type IV secretory pathway VirB4 component
MANKSLFQISQEYLQIAEQLENDELTPELEQALVINQDQFIVKAENYVHIIKQLEADLEQAKKAKEQIRAFEDRKKRVLEKLESNLENAVKLYGPVEAGFYKLSLRKSESVEIQDESLIPIDYKNIKITEAPDKTAIKNALKEGYSVPGANLITNQNLQIK